MLPLRISSQKCLACTRSFSSTSAVGKKNILDVAFEEPSPYPYGPAQWFKQANKGLYGGSRIQFGNNISERTETKTRRRWWPNVSHKHLYSQAMKRRIRIRVSTRVLRTIDKVGGLDEYLLGEKTARLRELGIGGWRLRCMLMATPSVQDRLNAQRRLFGLPEVDYKTLKRMAIEAPPNAVTAPLEPNEEIEFEVDEEELQRAETEQSAATGAQDTQVYEESREQMFKERVDEAREQNQTR